MTQPLADRTAPPENIRGVLIAARALIAEPEHWTQDTSARTAEGLSCSVVDSELYSRCMVAAINHVTASHYEDTLSYLGELIGPTPEQPYNASVTSRPVYFNDHHTHAEVLELLDRAIGPDTTA